MISHRSAVAFVLGSVLSFAACSSAGTDTATSDASTATTTGAASTTESATPEPTIPAATDATTASATTDGTAAPTTAPPESVEFELLTYNVAGLPAALSGSEPDINTALIAPRLNDYDLVVVQESWLNPEGTPAGSGTYHGILVEASDHEFASESMPSPFGTDPDRPSAALADGLNQFSDFPFESLERNRWTTCGDASADCLALKGFSVSTVTFADGVEADVYNLHLDAGREDFAVRAENVAELAAHINANAASRAVIVAGDFNLHLDRDPDADQFAELLASTGLIDVCTALECGEPNRIDRVLIRSGDGVEITPLEWRNEAVEFTRDDGEQLSDHDPVVARLRIAAG